MTTTGSILSGSVILLFSVAQGAPAKHDEKHPVSSRSRCARVQQPVYLQIACGISTAMSVKGLDFAAQT